MILLITVFFSIVYVVLLQAFPVVFEAESINYSDISRQLETAVFTSMLSGIDSLTRSQSVVDLLYDKAEPDNDDILKILDTVRRLFHSSLAYIVNRDGTVLACTPYNDGKTLTGLNYSFRPYVQSALKGQSIVYPALGLTTNERGLYFSTPVKLQTSGEVIGMIVVKIGMEKVDQIIASYKEPIFLLSPNKVVFATNKEEYLYHYGYLKEKEDVQSIRRSRQFGDIDLKPLPFFLDRNSVEFLDTDMLIHRESFLDSSWELIVLQENPHTYEINKRLLIWIFIFILIQLFVISYLIWNIQVRRKIEQDLRKSRKNYQTLFSLAPEGICISRMNGDILAFNEEFLRIFKLPADASSLSNFRDFYINPEEERSRLLKMLKEKGEIRKIILNLKDAEQHELRTVSSFALVDYNDESCIESIVRDMTEMEESEQLLRRAQKMEVIGTLSAGLAHDFNNLIGGITSVVSLLRLKIGRGKEISSKELVTSLNDMELPLSRTNELIRQLLSFSQNNECAHTTVDLSEVVKNVLNICRNSFSRSVTIREILPESQPFVNGNVAQLEQVLLNLCINASHAMTTMRPLEKQGGELTVSVEKENIGNEKFWKMSIGDTGVGIASEQLDQLFKPFFTTKKHNQGSGLGLMMVKNIIEQHNGVIDLETVPGKGTIFYLSFRAVN